MTEIQRSQDQPIDIGSRLELMVDDYLIDQMSDGAALRLHQPTMREVVMVTDEPWEGNACQYRSVFRDGDLYRMYYEADQFNKGEGTIPLGHPGFACYAESHDGIHWTKPALGLVEFDGSRQNNIVLADGPMGETELDAAHIAVFKDTNPECQPDAAYKAIVRVRKPRTALFALKSSDAIRFSLLFDQPIFTNLHFDSQNLAFWDGLRGEYRAYVRHFQGVVPDAAKGRITSEHGVRGILTATSKDFLNWTEPVWLNYPDAPTEQLYTNQIGPYERAPHIFMGFPMRYVDRGWTKHTDFLPELELRRERAAGSPRTGSAVTDGLFMSSRDGLNFKRWGEAFIRPGLRPQDNWVYGDNCIDWGIVETESDLPGAPNELSIYATESLWTGTSLNLRRYTLRLDGFVSVQAPLSGGEFVTRPLVFTGEQLVMNYSTSAAGSIRVEVQDQAGKPLEGLTLDDCPEIFGDDLEQIAHWADGSELGHLAGRPIRLRFAIKDADLYSIRFRP
jgi:hypothetical protein